jgi:diguanylate cyclase (GGDEF)-like protein/PAS domain S-box-containing protein
MKNQQADTCVDVTQVSSVSTAFVLPFLLIITLQVFLGVFSLEIMADIRAYTEGESHWSKAQKASIRALNEYAASAHENDYRQALRYLDVTSGDRQARLEMDKAQPDLGAIQAGFVGGGVAPGEVSGMVWLYRHMGFVPDVRAAITTWRAADAELDRLRLLADQLHQQIGRAPRDPQAIGAVLGNINRLDDNFSHLEDDFSHALARAGAVAQFTLKLAMLGAGLSLFALGLYYMRRVLAKNLQYQAMLTKSSERFNLALAGSNAGLWDWDIASNQIYCSPWIQRLLGYGDREQSYRAADFVQLVHPEDRRRNRRAIEAHLQGAAPYDIELRLCSTDGIAHWCRVVASVIRDAAGRPLRMVGSVSDVTERRQQERALFAEKERAQVTLGSIADAVIRTEIDGTVSYLNHAAEQLLKRAAASACGQPLMQVLQGRYAHNHEPLADPVAPIIAQRGAAGEAGADITLVRPDGSEVAIDLSIALIHDHAGAAVGTVLVLHDISREREHAEQLLHQATHDELTGLYNRRAFQAQLQVQLRTTHPGAPQHALLYLDLDQFKVVNDTCGHQAGDELIRQISAILKAGLRPCDCFARLGGDEFGIFLAECSPREAAVVAEQIRQSVREFRFVWRDKFFSVGVSIGLLNFQAQQYSLAELMSLADMACYVAKEKGRNRVHQHLGEDAELSARQGEMKWVMRLREALEQHDFCLYAQPIVDLRGGEPSGRHIEVLLRLRTEPNAAILPAAFIPTAERYNLMPALERWVVSETFATLAKRRSLGDDVAIEICAINLSGSSLGDPEFLDFVLAQQALHQVPLTTICFEITETAAVTNLPDALHFIETLRAHGCRFSLDDFGAGMSSFAYLKHLPVDFLKIDGALIKDIACDATDYAMVESINTIGHLMNKTTVAEFVESEETLLCLRAIGVDLAQGFVLAEPVPFSFAPDISGAGQLWPARDAAAPQACDAHASGDAALALAAAASGAGAAGHLPL